MNLVIEKPSDLPIDANNDMRQQWNDSLLPKNVPARLLDYDKDAKVLSGGYLVINGVIDGFIFKDINDEPMLHKVRVAGNVDIKTFVELPELTTDTKMTFQSEDGIKLIIDFTE